MFYLGIFLSLHLLSGFISALYITTRKEYNEAIKKALSENLYHPAVENVARNKNAVVALFTLFGFFTLFVWIRAFMNK